MAPPAPIDVTLATTNPGKIRELEAILEALGLPWRLLPRPDMGPLPETGATFEANALLKAEAVQRRAGGLALADDSGLVVDALQGAPGVHSARFAGEDATDVENNQRLAQAMEGVPAEARAARFVTVIALVGPQGTVAIAEGRCEGRLLDAPRGSGGFGYDPYFVPEGHNQTLAELSPEEKNALSHRGQALRRLGALLGPGT